MSDELTDDDTFDKCLWHFRTHLNIVMKPLRKYGQIPYVETATEEIISLAVQLHHKLSGLDEEPFVINEDKLHY